MKIENKNFPNYEVGIFLSLNPGEAGGWTSWKGSTLGPHCVHTVSTLGPQWVSDVRIRNLPDQVFVFAAADTHPPLRCQIQAMEILEQLKTIWICDLQKVPGC